MDADTWKQPKNLHWEEDRNVKCYTTLQIECEQGCVTWMSSSQSLVDVMEQTLAKKPASMLDTAMQRATMLQQGSDTSTELVDTEQGLC